MRSSVCSCALVLALSWACANQVPEASQFSTAGGGSGLDAAGPGDGGTTGQDALSPGVDGPVDAQAADFAEAEGGGSEVAQPDAASDQDAPAGSDGSSDASDTKTSCADTGCSAPPPCHEALCQADGSCTTKTLADNSGCGIAKSCHAGICQADPPKAERVVARGNVTCALLSDKTVKCWGEANKGQLGDGKSGDGLKSATPVLVKGVGGATDLACGGQHGCAVAGGGKVFCWGDNSFGKANPASAAAYQLQPTEVQGLGVATAVATGVSHTCALVADGKVRCWGLGTSGQLGDGVGGIPMKIVDVGFDGYVLGLHAGDHFNCARTTFNQVWCWGSSEYGQIGDGSVGSGKQADTPVQVANLANIQVFTTGPEHACAVDTGGSAWCWGRNHSGVALGSGLSTSYFTSPKSVVGVTGATGISAGGVHTCAILAGGQALCWGANTDGQVGVGATPLLVAQATPVAGFTAAAEVATGAAHSCARRTDGTIWCWGENSWGQCGPAGNADVLIPNKVL